MRFTQVWTSHKVMVSNQSDQMARLSLNIWPFTNKGLLNRIFLITRFHYFAKYYVIPHKIYQKLKKCCQSGEISPNLVRLLSNHDKKKYENDKKRLEEAQTFLKKVRLNTA